MRKALSITPALVAFIVALAFVVELAGIDVFNPLVIRSSYLEVNEIAAPANPAANAARVYAIDDSGTTKLAYRDSAGAQTMLGASLGAPDIVYDTVFSTPGAGNCTQANTGAVTFTDATVTITGGTLTAGSRVEVVALFRAENFGATAHVPTVSLGGTQVSSSAAGGAQPTSMISDVMAVRGSTAHDHLSQRLYAGTTTSQNAGGILTNDLAVNQDITFGCTLNDANPANQCCISQRTVRIWQ